MDDERIRLILEGCYRAIENGGEPDLAALCGDEPAVRARVEKLLAHERALLLACRSPVAEPGPLVPANSMPTRIGEFTLLEPLGIGGMSHVYRARQDSLDREVALKVLRDEVVASATGRLRFQREASITAALDHPNIVPVYAAGEADGHVFLAMKLLRGQPLDRCPMPIQPRLVAKYGVEAASALQAAHDIGVVHRDIKPANIVIEKDTAFVVDFGLSSFAHTAGAITRPDSTPGTLIYLAPEIARRRSTGLDPRVDVYGLGATLYESLAGQPPFDATNPMRALFQILHQDPEPLRLGGRDRDLETIVLRAMEKSPQRRFQSAAEMAEELQRYRDGLPIKSRPLGWIDRSVRWVMRHRTTAALLAISLALGLALVTVLWLQAHNRGERLTRAVAAAQMAIDQGDVPFADQQLMAMVSMFGGADAIHRLQEEVDSERRVQALIASLQSPMTHQDPKLLHTLVQQVGEGRTAVARTERAEVALAIASRLLDADPTSHRALAEATRRHWPRTTAALGAWSRGASPATDLRQLVPSAESLDHLFAAMVLRLANEPGVVVEHELRLAEARRPAADAIQHSLAWALEAQGQLAAAADCSAGLIDSPIYAGLALLHRARLVAILGNAEEARRLLATAIAVNARTPHLSHVTLLSELEVLLAVDVERFWRRWRQLATEAEHLPRYWLMAGYATVDSAEPPLSVDLADTARGYFERGLRCQCRFGSQLALQVACLQLDWLHSPACLSLDPLPDEPENATERQRLRELAQRAEAFANSSHTDRAAQDVRADAMLVAALAYRAAGDRARGWRVLETTCRDHGDPAALARFALLVGTRVASVHLDEPDFVDPEVDVGPPLQEAASKGMLRAQQVLAAVPTRRRIDASSEEAARQGLFFCALQLGDAEVCLPAALQLRDATTTDPELQALLTRVIDAGGCHLERLLPKGGEPASQAASKLLGACFALQRARDVGSLTEAAVAATVQRWRAWPPLAATEARAEPGWTALWRQVAALERPAMAPITPR